MRVEVGALEFARLHLQLISRKNRARVTKLEQICGKRYFLTSEIQLGISHNVSRVGDVALSPTRAKGHVAERRAAAPRSPRRLPRRRCAYALLCEVPFHLFSLEPAGARFLP